MGYCSQESHGLEGIERHSQPMLSSVMMSGLLILALIDSEYSIPLSTCARETESASTIYFASTSEAAGFAGSKTTRPSIEYLPRTSAQRYFSTRMGESLTARKLNTRRPKGNTDKPVDITSSE